VKLAVPISKPCPKDDFATLVLKKVEIKTETTKSPATTVMGCFGIYRVFSLYSDIAYRIKEIRKPVTIVIVFIASKEILSDDTKIKGERMTVIKKIIKEIFSNLFSLFSATCEFSVACVVVPILLSE
jgi:hypothetical protein